LQGKIKELEEKIRNAEVVTKNHSGRVQIGSTVKVEINGEETEFSIVDSGSADPLNGKISSDSPIGRGLLGKLENETALIEIAGEKNTYRILKVE